jgi:hypothetical protein
MVPSGRPKPALRSSRQVQRRVGQAELNWLANGWSGSYGTVAECPARKGRAPSARPMPGCARSVPPRLRGHGVHPKATPRGPRNRRNQPPTYRRRCAELARMPRRTPLGTGTLRPDAAKVTEYSTRSLPFTTHRNVFTTHRKVFTTHRKVFTTHRPRSLRNLWRRGDSDEPSAPGRVQTRPGAGTPQGFLHRWRDRYLDSPDAPDHFAPPCVHGCTPVIGAVQLV